MENRKGMTEAKNPSRDATIFVNDDELLKFIEEEKQNGLSQKEAWEKYEAIRRSYGAKRNRFKTIQSFNMWKSRYLTT